MALRIGWLVPVLLLASCGGAAPGAGAPPPPPAPVLLLGLFITPEVSTPFPGASVSLTAVVKYDDGTMFATSATWTTPSSPVLSLNSTEGPTITAHAGICGTATVHASSPFGAADATVEVSGTEIPATPPPLYRNDIKPGMENFQDRGFLLDPSASKLYTFGLSGQGVYSMNLDGTSPTLVGSWPSDVLSTSPFSLDYDTRGRIYTRNYTDTYRMDPVTGSSRKVGSGGAGWCLAIGPDDTLYTSDMFWSPGEAMLYKVAGIPEENQPIVAKTTLVPFGWSPTYDSSSWTIPGGIAINHRNEVFAMECNNAIVARYIDVNGDGDALDAGEQTDFATIPDVPSWSTISMGITDAVGGTIFVNIMGWGEATDPAGVGIYWLADRDGSGTCEGTTEIVRVANDWCSNGSDWGCLRSPRQRNMR